MNLIKIKTLGIVGILLLSFLTHFLYNLFPNDLFAIFFPVNESIWEHMKMLFSTILLYGIIEYYLLEHYHIKYNNYLLSLLITGVSSIIIYLSLFLPFYYTIGYSEILVFTTLIITIILIQLISYFILENKSLELTKISIILISIIYVVFGFLTYNPPKTDLFYDKSEEKYGIHNYNI